MRPGWADTVACPALHRDRECLLRRFLREIEVAELADERREDAAPLIAEDLVEQRAYRSTIGRTSTVPPMRAAGTRAARAVAASRLSASAGKFAPALRTFSEHCCHHGRLSAVAAAGRFRSMGGIAAGGVPVVGVPVSLLRSRPQVRILLGALTGARWSMDRRGWCSSLPRYLSGGGTVPGGPDALSTPYECGAA